MTSEQQRKEELYGRVWRLAAKREGHVYRFPTFGTGGAPKSEIPKHILRILKDGPASAADIGRVLGFTVQTIQKYLYEVRDAGEIHSVQEGRYATWHLGPALEASQ